MKRLLALVLACLLPCAALAETMSASMKLSVNEEHLATAMTKRFADVFDGSADAGTLLSIVAQLLNGAEIGVVSQEDAASITMSLSGKQLLDFAVYTDGDAGYLTSDLMCGYALRFSVSDMENADPVGSVDWEGVASSMVGAALQQASSIQHESTHGAFAGDAYTGGTRCETITLDDRDIAELLQAMMTPEARSAVSALSEFLGMNAEATFAQLDELHAQAASSNAHRYIIRYVTDDAYEPVGLSVTVMREEAQLATLSLGFGDGLIRIVIGAGSGEINNWYDHVIRWSWQDGTHFSGNCVQFTGNKDEDFAYAAAVADEMISTGTWQLDVTDENGSQAWYFEHEAISGSNGSKEKLISISQASEQTSSFTNATMLLLDDQEVAALEIKMDPADALPSMPDDLTICDLDSTDAEQLAIQQEISAMLTKMLSARLLTILPPQLLMLLN